MIIEEGNSKENNQNNSKNSVKKFAEDTNEKIKKKKENDFIFEIIKSIKLIIEFSKKNKTFLIYFTNNFWKYILSCYNEPNQDNIYICFQFREIFIEYYNLVIEIFKDKERKKFVLKNDAINYYELDEFAFLLDQMIRKFINKKELENIEKLAYITQYNPYYIDRNMNKIDANIFDSFNLNNIDDNFIEDFRNMNFESIFKENINEYINKITSKIESIYDFDIVIKLINIKNIENKNILLNSLTKIYDKIIKKGIDKNFNKYEIFAKLAIIYYIYETNEKKKISFIENKIKKLDEDKISKIFIEIMRIYINKKKISKIEDEIINDEEKKKEEEDLKKIKDYILTEFLNLNKESDINNIIALIECLDEKENKKDDKADEDNKDNEENNKIISEFLNKLLDEKKLFKKEDFFSNKENLKILLLSKLNEKAILRKYDAEEFYDNIKELMGNIKKDIDGEINKKNLDEFLNIQESIIRKRLSLLNIIYDNFNSKEEYEKLKRINEEINKDINKLIDIKDNIIIYHKETYKEQIKKLIDIIKDNQNKKITDYKQGKIKDFIKELNILETTVTNVKNVKNNLLFNVIYEDLNVGKNERVNFEKAYEKLGAIGELLKKNINIGELYNNKEYKNIFDKIKKKLSNNEERAKDFIENMISYYDIKDKNLIDELTILFKIEKYKMDINSIIFFFEYFQKDNPKWNNNLDKEKFKNLFMMPMEKENEPTNDFKNIKAFLIELKNNKIYDYNNIENYYKLFTCLYDKNEAIDFLFSKIDQDIKILYDRIQPTDRTISIKDIKYTEECISAFKKMKNLEDNFRIFDYIKSMDEDMISKFENYSRIYSSVIELDTFYDNSQNLFEEVHDKLKEETFHIFQDTDSFNLKELIHLKNKIHIKRENENDKKEIKNSEDKKLNSKCKILNFFKDVVTNLEIINGHMRVLRMKGSSLPIKISIMTSIKDNEPTIKYYLDGKETEFIYIRDFLFNAKNNYISQINALYKEKLNIRFLYGKQFRSVMKHLESGYNIDSFLRFILNIKENNSIIKEGYKAISRNVTDFIKEYELYNKNSLDSISTYITSVFQENDISLEKHYNKMKIIFNRSHRPSLINNLQDNFKRLNNAIINNKCKGIYLHECENNSMERFILNLFWDKIGELPIAQNVLITNKETSSEEMQAFFHRAILCNYNTLFVVEINDSFSDNQQSIMNRYIANLLSEKFKNYKETENDEDANKKDTGKYLDSCIVFIYDKKNKNNIFFLREINKYEKQDIACNEKINDNNDKFLSDLGHIMVVSSDLCGLGKSEKIKKTIKDANKEYFHFPLGGILTKDVIFKKLDSLLKEIKKRNYNYKDIAIHLDLTESEETSILNEFFFSFLITKFYLNNESIIYIPNDIDIYIEIPNCFENYSSKFGILNIFKKENITLANMPPFNYSKEMIDIFNRMLGINSNEGIKEFVEKYFKKIGIEKYTYHQINIFIKLFISQYSKFKGKLIFKNNNVDVTEQCIEDFSKSTKYFTNGGFAKLLTGTDNYNKNKDYIDKLSEIYDNDLKGMEFPDPLIFIIKEKMVYDKLYIPTKDSNKNKDSRKYVNSNDYLKRIKEILNLPNDVEKEVEKDGKKLKSLLSIIEEKNNNYVITIDNFKKMVLLIYRIKANVPVILMGETGCGKTALITKLNQILNNGETNVEIINIHPGITDDKLCDIMDQKNELAQKQKDKELWLFFDEMNTCLSLSLLTEIFINRSYNSKKLSDNIRLIGACNPYRRRKGDKEKCGLSKSDDNDKELVYLVQPLPQSLLYYVFSFGRIDDIDEKKYIHSIIEKLFTEQEKDLHESTTEVISECHKYLRNTFDPSVVSLREIARFSKCLEFFQKYFTIKNNFERRSNNEKNNKLRSIICSIYICYYIRLTDDKKRNNFDNLLRPALLKLIINKKNDNSEGKDLMEEIKDEELGKEILKRPEEIIRNFSDFLKIEQDYILNKIELDKGIGKNTLLKENVFLLFLSVVTNIPLIIIGKPGTGKSLSAQLIDKSMKGIYSKNKFFKQFPKIIQTYFQGSESTQPADVESLFEKASNKLNYYKDNKLELPISMILFDELGLAEHSKSNPLKVLHSKLEYSGKEEGVSFVGISNYSLDAAKVNRALILSVPDLDQRVDELMKTSSNIVESISDKLKNDNIFEILSRTYFDYKNILQIIKELIVYKKFVQNDEHGNDEDKGKEEGKEEENISTIVEEGKTQASPSSKTEENNEGNLDGKDKPKEREKRQFEFIKGLKEFKNLFIKETKIRKDFHGNRDFYNLIKGIAIEFGRLGNDNDENDKLQIIEEYIERNFGGIDYEIDIDLDIKIEDIKANIQLIKDILKDYNGNEKKLNSVYLFKKLYNLIMQKEAPNSRLILKREIINNYNLNKCINDNIRDFNSRFLLLEVKQSLTTVIYQNIKLQNPFKDIIVYDGSPFADDNNEEYRFKKLNQIQENLRDDKLIILENLNPIHPFLFDLYNMNYIIKDEKKFARICLEDKFSEQLTEINDRLRIIILVDKKFVKKVNLAFLNRFEKMILSFDKLLENDLKILSNNLIGEMNLERSISDYPNINYELKDLLINCGEEEIQGLIYYYCNKSKKNDNDLKITKKESLEAIKENVYNKIYKILPQDIISILPNNNIIKEKYYRNKAIYNFKDYINKDENKKFKISIIYTYTSIANTVEGLDNDMSFMISEINSEDQLKTLIDELKIRNDNNKLKKDCNLYIHFEKSNSKKIKYISNLVLNNYKDDKYHYIFIVHINRNFKKQKNEKIYSLPDIYDDINQLFIDNLNGNNSIKLNDILGNNLKDIFVNNKESMKLDDEFNRILINYLIEKLREISLDEDTINNYINDIQNYINDEEYFKEKIIEVTIKLIDEDKNEEEEENNMIETLFNKNYISIYSLDIVSSLLEYIKNNKFNKYLKYILEKLENNNILTTLIEIKRNNYKYIKRDLVENIITKFVDEITLEKNNKCIPKFLFNYNIPGFYNFYINISNYINKNITTNYFNNEKKLRELFKSTFEKIKDFHEKEESLLSNVYKECEKDEFIFENAKKIDENLILIDYITFFLQKYKNKDGIYKNDDIYHKLIELLLKLRFDDKTIIKENENNKINILLIKIIWIESNVNYILNILKIIEFALEIFGNDEKNLFKEIEELISKNNIKYLTNELKNPEHTKEVNECYYILLASICYSITSDKVNLSNKEKENYIEIPHYYIKLKEINKILQNLNNDLYIYLNEMYIVDELIKVIELFNNNIKKINEIKSDLIENSQIIQNYSFKKETSEKLGDELCDNFDKIYNSIMKEEKSKDFYDKLRYILFKEIKKISISDYRYQIFSKIIEENQMIKKSNDIFQIILNNYVRKDKFKDIRNTILNSKDEILKLIEEKLNEKEKNNFILFETLLYFFEKNSLNYLKVNLNKKDKDKKNEEDESLEIFKGCIEFLNYYISKPDKVASKLKEIGKLFCLGYIKAYLNNFIKMLDNDKIKYDPKKIIDVINGSDSICKMIRIYIYKILYNKYNIDVFINKESINKYKLEEFKDFKTLIKPDELINIYKIDYEVNTLKFEDYNNSYTKLEKYKKDQFKKKISSRDCDVKGYGIDNFYIISFNLILSDLKRNNYVSDINNNFYNNVVKILFSKSSNLTKAIELFYDPKNYEENKKNYNINSDNITPILYGYRYVLNELSSENKNGIYYPIYSNLNLLKEGLYPGNDSEYNKEFSKIINHFKSKPNEGCYICLCKDCYYHSIPSGFPSTKEKDMKCPKCNKPLGVKRDDYYRIFKDDEEIRALKRDKDKKKMIEKMNCLTLENFKEKYIYESQKKEKGVFVSDKNNFKSDNKIIRNLSQISYRLLNYILYSHLFFARLITNKREIKNYLPKGMEFAETLYECWILLKNELLKEEIYSIEKFMNYIFTDLFPILNKEGSIENYDKLIKFEDELESHIQKLIKKFKEDNNNSNNNNNEDPNSFVNLLKEKYTSSNEKEFPFYDFFYYTDYLNEKNINEKLNHMDEDKYPVLKKFLEYLNNKIEQNNYSSNNLNLFNNVLNLFFEKYSNYISRSDAEKKILKNEDIYIENKELIDSFILFFNNLKKEDPEKKKKILELTNESHLIDFFITDNKFGKTYKDIYQSFIKEQNNRIKDLLEIKIQNGVFDENCLNKINIQQINEKEIFTFDLPKEISFIDILFNSSYRKILDNNNKNYDSYKEYKINYDLIEENMTDLLLKNKKLLNDEITEFIYNNEVFSNEIADSITSFKKLFNCKKIDIHDKTDIYKFCTENKGNTHLYKDMINDFITLIKFLNEKRKEDNNKDDNIKEESKIYEILNKFQGKISDNFIEIFRSKEGLTIDKTPEIFEYYLKSIYEDVSAEINEYQIELDDDSKNIIDIYSYHINKEDFAHAIRLFMTLVLFLEDDKENKIKSNRNNIINYLKAPDLWNKDIDDKQTFYSNLNELKQINAQINQIIPLYELLGKDIADNFFDEVKKMIKDDDENPQTEKKIDEIPDNIDVDKKEDPFAQPDDDDDPFAENDDEDDDERQV